MPKAVGILWLIIWGDLGMSFEWPIKTLGEVCSKITDGAHHSPKSVAIGKPMASVKDLTRFGVDLSEARLISNEDFDFLVRQGCKPEIEDVLISKDGNSALDTVCNVKQPLDAVLLSSVAILRPNLLLITSDYLKYYLSSKDVIEYLKSNFISGAAIPRIVLKDFKKAEIQLPPLDIQNKITSILNPLDNRISLLRETNITLEAIAQTLFKSWFVDFDPVKAKAEGKQPEGMDEATAALFPSEFEESALGLIPKGWRVERLGSVIPVKDGTHESPKPTESGYPLITSRHITGGKMDFDNTYLISDVDFINISKRSRVDRFDVLITMIGTVGIPVIVLEDKTDFAIKNIGLFKTSSKLEFSHYLYLLLLSSNMKHYIEARLAGTTQKYVSLKALREIEIILPSGDILSMFSQVTFSLFDKIHENDGLIKNLTTLRDTLLPRLISGQLRINQAQDLINEVGA